MKNITLTTHGDVTDAMQVIEASLEMLRSKRDAATADTDVFFGESGEGRREQANRLMLSALAMYGQLVLPQGDRPAIMARLATQYGIIA